MDAFKLVKKCNFQANASLVRLVIFTVAQTFLALSLIIFHITSYDQLEIGCNGVTAWNLVSYETSQGEVSSCKI